MHSEMILLNRSKEVSPMLTYNTPCESCLRLQRAVGLRSVTGCEKPLNRSFLSPSFSSRWEKLKLAEITPFTDQLSAAAQSESL